jgi:DNA-binding NarL/FixJ family response regulator
MTVSIVLLDATAQPPPAEFLGDRQEVARYDGVETYLRRAPGAGRDVVLLVTRRCGQALSAAVAAVTGQAAPGAIVVLCDRVGGKEARSLLAAGVGGLVLSGEAHRALAATIGAVDAGQVCVPRRHARHVERPGLSTREKQVIGLVALGFSNGEIAERLFLAQSTVKSHLSSAFGKLGVRSRHEAVELIVNPAFGLANGIMSLGAEPIAPEDGQPADKL